MRSRSSSCAARVEPSLQVSISMTSPTSTADLTHERAPNSTRHGRHRHQYASTHHRRSARTLCRRWRRADRRMRSSHGCHRNPILNSRSRSRNSPRGEGFRLVREVGPAVAKELICRADRFLLRRLCNFALSTAWSPMTNSLQRPRLSPNRWRANPHFRCSQQGAESTRSWRRLRVLAGRERRRQPRGCAA